MSTHFSQNRSLEWQELHDKWEFAWDNYTGEYMDADKIRDYLPQRQQREGNQAYDARRKSSDPILHFPTAVDSINGMVTDATRDFGDLGDPDEPGSTAYSLWRNADGRGTNWEPLLKRAGIKLTVMHKLWGLVDGIETDADGRTLSEASIKLIDPSSVVDYYPKHRTPEAVLVREKRDMRTSITDEPKMHDVYTLYEIEGWRRFYVKEGEDANGNKFSSEEVIASGEYEYYADAERRVRTLPIFCTELPLPRFIGYLLAKKQNHIFNFKSLRDFGASNLSLAILKIKADDKQFDDITDKLLKGYNSIREDPTVQGSGHSFISPDSSYLSEAGRILEKDVEEFYYNAFKEYSDAARQATATEIRQVSSSGIEAFLTLLVQTLDEFENACLWRLLQVYFPKNPESWGTANVERSTDFQPQDIEASLERMKKRFFGDAAIPIPSKYKAELAAMFVEREGVAIEREGDDYPLFEQVVSRSIDAQTADAVSKLVGQGLSVESTVRLLHPEWTDEQVAAEVARIQSEDPLRNIPDPFQGD